jgi:S-formylglutathione hydrolase FrmB
MSGLATTMYSISVDNGTHSWEYWGAQPQAMKPDLQKVLGTR